MADKTPHGYLCDGPATRRGWPHVAPCGKTEDDAVCACGCTGYDEWCYAEEVEKLRTIAELQKQELEWIEKKAAVDLGQGPLHKVLCEVHLQRGGLIPLLREAIDRES